MNQYKSNKHMYTIDRKNLNRLLKFLFSISFFFFSIFTFRFSILFGNIISFTLCFFLRRQWIYVLIYVWRPFCLDRGSFVDVNAFNLAWISRKLNVIHRGITNISFLGCPLNLKRCTSKLNVDSNVQQWLHYQNCIITS